MTSVACYVVREVMRGRANLHNQDLFLSDCETCHEVGFSQSCVCGFYAASVGRSVLEKVLARRGIPVWILSPRSGKPDTLTTKNAGRIRDRLVEERPDRRFESAPAEIQRECVLCILCTDLDAPPAHHTL